MDKIIKDTEFLEEIKDKNRDGEFLIELLDKINEIVDWINKQ